MSHPCLPGSTVVVRDQPWRVVKVDAFERCSILTLETGSGGRLRVIDPFDRVARVERSTITHRARRTVLRAALTAACSERPATGLWTAARASIDLLPYQLEPALAVLRGATRVLLADGVGLGKTIQAGLILSELRARSAVERALIVCPVGLRASWSSELRRFGIACVALDQLEIAEAVSRLPPGINPWTSHDTIVTSIDFIKRPEVLAALTGVPIDIVIADEAHHLTPGTARAAAVQTLASRSPWFVMLTATPHSGDEAAFEYLAALGQHGDRLAIFRRSRRDAGLPSSRRERLLRVQPDAQEAAVLAAVDRYTRAIWEQEGATNASAQLVAITIARRAASSVTALDRTLRRRLELLGSEPVAIQPTLPWDEDEEGDGFSPTHVLRVAGLHDRDAERRAIAHLLTLVATCGPSSKVRWIARAVRRITEPSIVFTEYRDTLDALTRELTGLRVVEISGATPADQRRRVVDAFNEGEADVLLATDTAGEGLNLHHRCRLVIDVELPWNPLRLEQRLGRVDRLGQHKRVHALRLFHPGTIEERVLERLSLRRSRAERLDHPPAIDERAVARAVLASEPFELHATPPVAGIVIGGADAECARLNQLRGLALPPGRVDAVAAAPRRRRTVRMCVVHTLTCLNSAGAIVAERVVAHRVVANYARVPERRATARGVFTAHQLTTAVRSECDRLCNEVDADLRPFREAVTSRIASIRSLLRRRQGRGVQRSLFDRRAERAQAVADVAYRALDDALRRRWSSIGSAVERAGSIVRSIAAWPEDPR